MTVSLRRFIWGTALTPIGAFALFWSFILLVRVELGRWPSVSDPNPIDQGVLSPFLYFFVLYALFAAILAVPALLVAVVAAWSRWPAKQRWVLVAAIVVCIVASVGSFYVYRLNPGGAVEWFID